MQQSDIKDCSKWPQTWSRTLQNYIFLTAACNYVVFQVHWSHLPAMLLTKSSHFPSVSTGSAVTIKKICLLGICVSLPPQRGRRTSTTITQNLSVSFSNTYPLLWLCEEFVVWKLTVTLSSQQDLRLSSAQLSVKLVWYVMTWKQIWLFRLFALSIPPPRIRSSEFSHLSKYTCSSLCNVCLI